MGIALLPLVALAAAAAPNDGGGAALVRAEQDWMAAMRHRDGVALRRFVDPAFTLTGTTEIGRAAVPARVWLDNALHHLSVQRFRFEALRTEAKGDVGIVRARFRWRGTYDGQAFDDGGSLVDVWQRRGGRWRVVARIITGETG